MILATHTQQGMIYIPSTPQEMNELWLERMSIPFMALNLGYVVILKYCLIAFSCLDFMVRASPDDMPVHCSYWMCLNLRVRMCLI